MKHYHFRTAIVERILKFRRIKGRSGNKIFIYHFFKIFCIEAFAVKYYDI